MSHFSTETESTEISRNRICVALYTVLTKAASLNVIRFRHVCFLSLLYRSNIIRVFSIQVRKYNPLDVLEQILDSFQMKRQILLNDFVIM